MAQHEDFGVLGPVPATAQHQQVDHESDETVEAGHALILIDATRTKQIETQNPRSRRPDEFSAPTGFRSRRLAARSVRGSVLVGVRDISRSRRRCPKRIRVGGGTGGA